MDITEYAMMKKVFKKLSPDSDPVLQEKTITENGEYTPDDGYDGLSKVIVNVAGGGGGSADLVYVTFMSHDGAKELHKRAVVKGNTCMCPVTGAIKEIDTPTRESTELYRYIFGGWSTTPNGALNESALEAITADKTVYAYFTAVTRFYTVNFYDGNTLLSTQQVAYGMSATPPAVEKEGFQLDGWQPAYTNITADTDCYAQWNEAITFANGTWEQIAEICDAGEAASYFKVGDTKTIPVTIDGVVYPHIVKIVGINHDDLADGSGKAQLSIMFFTMAHKVAAANSANSTLYLLALNSWKEAVAFKDFLPTELQNVIKTVTKSYNRMYGSTQQQETVECDTWLPSITELNGNAYLDIVCGEQYEAFTTETFGVGTNAIYDTDGKVFGGYCHLRNRSNTTKAITWEVIDTDATYASVSLTQICYVGVGFCV